MHLANGQMQSSLLPAGPLVNVTDFVQVLVVEGHTRLLMCVYHTGKTLSFGCAMTIVLYSHTDASGVLFSSG